MKVTSHNCSLVTWVDTSDKTNRRAINQKFTPKNDNCTSSLKKTFSGN